MWPIRKTSVSGIMKDIEKQLTKLDEHRTNLQLEAIGIEEKLSALDKKLETVLQEDEDAKRVSNNLSKILYGEV